MAGYTIQCTVKKYPGVLRELKIPDRMSFLELSQCLNIAFDWEEDDDHYFMLSDSQVPLSPEKSRSKREMYESDVNVKSFMDSKESILYIYETDAEDYEIQIVCKRSLPAYSSNCATMTKAEKMLPRAFRWQGSEYLPVYDPLKSVADFNRLLQSNPSMLDASKSPDLEQVSGDYLDYIDDNSGLGPDYMRKIYNTMDERAKNQPDYPPVGKDEKRGSLFTNLSQVNDYEEGKTTISYTLKLSGKTVENMLMDLGPLGLYDFCKYLQLIDAMKSTPEKRAKAIVQFYQADPSILFYPLSDAEREALLSLPALLNEGKNYTGASLSTLILLGLAVFDPKNQTLEIAKDLPQILAGLNPKRADKTIALLKQFDHGFPILMKHYGLIALDQVPELMEKYFSMTLSFKECYRLIYFKYSLMAIYQTFVCFENHYSYVSEKGLDIKSFLPIYIISENMAPFAEMTSHQLYQWENSGDYMNVFAGWTFLYGFLALNCQIKQEDARQYCDDFYHRVRNGEGLKKLMDDFPKANNAQLDYVSRLLSWEICLHFVLGTSIPCLKGANRIITFSDPRYSMFMYENFVDNPVKDDQIITGTHIEDMPERIQIEIASRLYTLQETDLQPLMKIYQQFSDNIDINYIVGTAHARLKHMEDATRFFARAYQLSDYKDEGLKMVLDTAKDDKIFGIPISLSPNGVIDMRMTYDPDWMDNDFTYDD